MLIIIDKTGTIMLICYSPLFLIRNCVPLWKHLARVGLRNGWLTITSHLSYWIRNEFLTINNDKALWDTPLGNIPTLFKWSVPGEASLLLQEGGWRMFPSNRNSAPPISGGMREEEDLSDSPTPEHSDSVLSKGFISNGAELGDTNRRQIKYK